MKGWLTFAGRTSSTPVSSVINRFLGEALFYDRQYEAAVRQLRHTLAMAPDLPMTRRYLAAAYTADGLAGRRSAPTSEILRSAGREKEAQALGEAFVAGGEQGQPQMGNRSRSLAAR